MSINSTTSIDIDFISAYPMEIRGHAQLILAILEQAVIDNDTAFFASEKYSWYCGLLGCDPIILSKELLPKLKEHHDTARRRKAALFNADAIQAMVDAGVSRKGLCEALDLPYDKLHPLLRSLRIHIRNSTHMKMQEQRIDAMKYYELHKKGLTVKQIIAKLNVTGKAYNELLRTVTKFIKEIDDAR